LSDSLKIEPVNSEQLRLKISMYTKDFGIICENEETRFFQKTGFLYLLNSNDLDKVAMMLTRKCLTTNHQLLKKQKALGSVAVFPPQTLFTLLLTHTNID